MYRRIDDFVADWKVEREMTLKIFSKITDKSKSIKVSENIRTLGRLAWHITQTLTEMPHKAGIFGVDFLDGKPIPSTFNEIIDTYEKYSTDLIKAITDNWPDACLAEKVNIYGQEWEKRKILAALVKHQIHHRGQMTTLMRLNNIEVPGIYGPSKEEWTKFGMQPHE